MVWMDVAESMLPTLRPTPKCRPSLTAISYTSSASGIPSAGMPEFASSLDDAQIRAVVSYLRILQGKGRRFP